MRANRGIPFGINHALIARAPVICPSFDSLSDEFCLSVPRLCCALVSWFEGYLAIYLVVGSEAVGLVILNQEETTGQCRDSSRAWLLLLADHGVICSSSRRNKLQSGWALKEHERAH